MDTNKVREVQIGSAFRVRFVNSGVTASPIFYNIFNKSDTLVGSWTGASSGNGHYFANPYIQENSWDPGVFRGRWTAVIDSRTYTYHNWIQAYPQGIAQPGRYVGWVDIVDRFEDFANFGGAIKIASHYVAYAEAQIDGILGTHFSIPFSNNNATVRDLVVDMAYARAIRGKSDAYKAIISDVSSRISALKRGDAVMVTDVGTVTAVRPDRSAAWSSTQDYHPVFGMSDPIDWTTSSAELIDEDDARGL